jgi:hypothetical protein
MDVFIESLQVSALRVLGYASPGRELAGSGGGAQKAG